MISITQDLKFKQAVVEYSFKHGVTAARVSAAHLSMPSTRYGAILENLHVLEET